MNKKLLTCAAVAATCGVACAIKRSDFFDSMQSAHFDLSNQKLSDKWNPLEAVELSEQKESTAENLAKAILDAAGMREASFFNACENDLLTSLILFVSKTDDKTLPHIYDIVAEMAALGESYSAPEQLKDDPAWQSFSKLDPKVKMAVIESLFLKLESLGCEKYREILAGGDIHPGDFAKGCKIRIVEPGERTCFSNLIEQILIKRGAAWEA